MHPLSQFKYCPKCGSNRFVENNIKSKRCENCGFVYYFNSCSSTVAIIVNENNELLVATRAHEPVKGTLDLPGGFVDMHETGEEAVIREVKEETNLNVTETEYLFSIPNIYVYSGFEVHTLDLVYRCKVESTATLKAEDDVANLQFIKIPELNPDLFGLLSVKEIVRKIQKMKI
ncbi:NAD+ diphosphatase [Dysgonomonas sp. PFB1-18]|uniref:NUDIX hydrolase n=1 Tax=unclassified Dysgonomonas TaxID=2630389 RepID=UPI0024733BDA|nr:MULTISPECIES: NUDIX domain-containing protein [unclassified Dysgonomonas]MDH6307977.1 NAD+ diphosphatase [Dysgonomonas sp. PF1-14]MDH6339516.1 NAD+ diphosphatase [Dysgonomonas sp. PF1-16]MDH6381167.1 NAD+ diphosphatase [Dysgonomonas sp. PFB1-18]MDH6398379.1 NAD+ diphosphatase [Dysgonomonas sp. PF1-23]